MELKGDPFDPWQMLQDYQQRHYQQQGAASGASVIFVGTMRDLTDDESVQAMVLEHYPGMTESYLAVISREAAARWPLLDLLLIHRYGRLLPGEPIVLVAVWSAHRSAAFAACRYLIEELKSRVPLWKQEERSGGRYWIQSMDGVN